MTRSRAVATALLAAVVILALGPTGAAAGPRLLFRIADQRIAEASGLAVGRASPGVVYVQNDSGDTNRFFALDNRSGVTVATVTVPGARNVDWEDLAAAPDRAGRRSVWLADIGDNTRARAEIQVYRVNEPRIAPGLRSASGHRSASVSTPRPDVWRLRYPDGPADAESFAVSPDGDGYVITKSFTGTSVVYRLPARPDRDRVQVLREVGRVRFGLTGTPGGPNPIGQLTATSASISADGAVLAVRTYTDAYLWRLAGGDIGAALTRTPTRIPLPAQSSGEGVAVDGAALLVDSEGVGSPVYSVPIPPGSRTRSAVPGPTPPSGAPPPASSTPRADDHPSTVVVVVVAVAGAVGLLILLGGILARRRGRAG